MEHTWLTHTTGQKHLAISVPPMQPLINNMGVGLKTFQLSGLLAKITDVCI